MDELKIVYLPVGELKPYERNARKHEDADIQTIVNSIKQFGFRDPIGIWGEQNIIVEGHGRLLAAQRLGMDEVPCIRLDDMTDEQRRAYALAHNKTAEMSSWLDDMLKQELADIETFDMTDFGFENEKQWLTETTPADEDDEPEVEFSEVLGEENNYVVLQFKTDIDWLNAQTILGITTVKSSSTRKDGVLTEKMVRRGTARVLDGAKVLRELVGDL